MPNTDTAMLAILLGVIAGLRTMTPPAAIAWGAWLGRLRLDGTALAFLNSPITAWLFAAMALGELVVDKLPVTPSRTRPGPFAARILSGAFSGAALTAGVGGALWPGALLGALGAVAGTLGGHALRTRLVPALQVPDYVVALAEDVLAVGGAVLIVAAGTGRRSPGG